MKGPLNESIQTQDSKKPHEFCILHSHPFPLPSFDSFIHMSISLLLLMIEDDDHYSQFLFSHNNSVISFFLHHQHIIITSHHHTSPS